MFVGKYTVRPMDPSWARKPLLNWCVIWNSSVICPTKKRNCKRTIINQLYPRNLYNIDTILFMEEIMHHLTCMKPCKQWYIYHINWCRISSINSISKLNHLFQSIILGYALVSFQAGLKKLPRKTCRISSSSSVFSRGSGHCLV